MKQSKYQTIEPGLYNLPSQVANPMPGEKNWLSCLPIFPAGDYLAVNVRNWMLKQNITRIYRKGQRGMITSLQAASFEAITKRLVFMGKVERKPKRKQGRPKAPEKPFDVAAFVATLEKPLNVRGVQRRAHWVGISKRRFYDGGIWGEVQAHLEQTETGLWVVPGKQYAPEPPEQLNPGQQVLRMRNRTVEPLPAETVAAYLRTLPDGPVKMRWLAVRAAEQGIPRWRFYGKGGLMDELKRTLEPLEGGYWIHKPKNFSDASVSIPDTSDDWS